MATILDAINFSPYKRPKYIRYELSSLVKKKRAEMNMEIEEFASVFDVPVKDIEEIELCQRLFGQQLYETCMKVLNMSFEEILAEDKDEDVVTEFPNEEIKQAYEIANLIFQEMIMQEKISTN